MAQQEAVHDQIEAGREALERRAWREAYDLLSDACCDGALSAEDCEGLSRAACSRAGSTSHWPPASGPLPPT